MFFCFAPLQIAKAEAPKAVAPKKVKQTKQAKVAAAEVAEMAAVEEEEKVEEEEEVEEEAAAAAEAAVKAEEVEVEVAEAGSALAHFAPPRLSLGRSPNEVYAPIWSPGPNHHDADAQACSHTHQPCLITWPST